MAVFVDITIRSDRGRKSDLKQYFDVADAAMQKVARSEHIVYGVVGRRAVVSERTLTKHMVRHGIYKKAWR